VKSESKSARDYLASLAAAGRYDFTSREAQAALGVSVAAAKLALNRLAKQGQIASPARGFHVIVPPEYRRLGCLPAEQFIPSLMARRGLVYYAGLLSAAQYHGAAHHRPQAFQVIVEKNRRAIECGAVRAVFVARKRLAEVPVQEVNTPRGRLRVSTPEATAIDLVGYPHHAGGLDNVATVLSELAEAIDPENLVAAAGTAPISWAQRLGYLLDRVGASDRAQALREYVAREAVDITPLRPGRRRGAGARDAAWKLDVNADVDVEA
jgi:predicted transcriptional regulator of viral defense system